MAHIVALSSWVAHGHVGLSAAAPVLQRLGHRVTQLPTVQLSNHPGFAHVAGERTPPDTLRAMIGALGANGWLETVDAVLTGYLPSAEHVEIAVELVDLLKACGARVVIDPVLGDSPKGLYIGKDAADALRDGLIAKADVLTPNTFELSWLAERPADTIPDTVAAVTSLRRANAEVFVTSAPFAEDETGVLAVRSIGVTAFRTPSVAEGLVPNGVGDVFSALIATGLPVEQALGHLQALIGESRGAPHLRIAEATSVWSAAPPVAGTPIAH